MRCDRLNTSFTPGYVCGKWKLPQQSRLCETQGTLSGYLDMRTNGNQPKFSCDKSYLKLWIEWTMNKLSTIIKSIYNVLVTPDSQTDQLLKKSGSNDRPTVAEFQIWKKLTFVRSVRDYSIDWILETEMNFIFMNWLLYMTDEK
jgi:hypothetical protein